MSSSTALSPRNEQSLGKPASTVSQWDLVELSPLIDFNDLWAIVKRRLPWLIAIPFLCAVVALAYCYLIATPLYKSTALVFVDPMFDRTLQVESVGPGISDLDSLNSLEKAIVSDSVVLRVMDRLDLWENLDFLPKSLHKTVEKGERLSSSRLLKELRDKRFSASLIRPTRLIELTVHDPDPHRAQLIAETFVQEFESFLGDQKRHEADHSTEELRAQADLAYTRALEAEKQLEQFRLKNPELTVEQDHQLFAERLSRIGNELNSISSRVIDLRSRVETLREVDPEADPIKVINLGRFAELEHVSDLLNQRISAHASLAALREQVTEINPRYREAKSRVAELDAQLKQLAVELKSSLEADYTAAVTNEKLLTERVTELQGQLTAVKTASSEFRAIQQRVETEWQVHQQLQQRIGQTSLDTEKSTAITTLMSEPIVAYKPSKPSKPIFALAGGFTGMLLALGLVTFDLFKGGPFRNRRQVEQNLDIPVAAEIGRSDDETNDPRLMQEMTRVLLTPDYRQARFVHLTSLWPKEQDLRIAACLASASAYYSCPTLLISVVAGGDPSLPVNLAPQASSTPNLHTLRLPAGCLRAQQNAWQLLSPHRQYFSRIIIETTSFSQESQIPAVVSSFADANLLVVERDRSTRIEIEEAIRDFRRTSESPLSLILQS